MLKDLRHAVRVLLHAKGWTTVIVISLALGIGANTALFSAVNGRLLKPIPVERPGSLVRFYAVGPSDMATSGSGYGPLPPETRATFSYPMFQQLAADNRTLSDLFACAPFGRLGVVADGRAEIATSFISTGNYYAVLGVKPTLGRLLTPKDDRPSAAPVALISHRYWVSRFGGDPRVVGKTVTIGPLAVTIVGVISPEFTGIQQPIAEPPDVSLPLALQPQLAPPSRLDQPTYWWLQILGRPKPGVTPEQVRANLDTIFQRTARDGMTSYLASLSATDRSASRNANRTHVPRLVVQSAAHGVYDPSPNELRSVAILGVVVLLVLLLVCANVANLLLSRAAGRRREIAVRLSIGATRRRLVRQLLTESLLLAGVGGLLGLTVGYWGRALLPGPSVTGTFVDWRLFGFVVGVTSLAGVLFGIAPALRATRVDLNAAMKEQSRSVISSKNLATRVLLVVQVAVSLVLLVGAGLFLRTVDNLRQVDVGFNPTRLALFHVSPSLSRYDLPRAFRLYADLLERLKAVPGVRSVSISHVALLSGSVNTTSFFVQGQMYPRDQRSGDEYSVNRVVVSDGFFETMEMPMVTGRGFSPRDGQDAPKIALINEAAVRRYFPNQSPIGHRFGPSPEQNGQFEIVGVVRDAKYNSLREPAPPTMYVPYLQAGPTALNGMFFEVRTAGDPATTIGTLRDVVRRVDPNLPATNVSTQLENIEERFVQEKLFARACTLFGAVALVLASIGLFGLISYSVACRTNEIGIRMALGAQRLDVLRLVMSESIRLVFVGIAVGAAAAVAAGHFVTALLFGVQPTDLVTMLGVAAMTILVAAVASYLPARRASRIDPLVALHEA